MHYQQRSQQFYQQQDLESQRRENTEGSHAVLQLVAGSYGFIVDFGRSRGVVSQIVEF